MNRWFGHGGAGELGEHICGDVGSGVPGNCAQCAFGPIQEAVGVLSLGAGDGEDAGEEPGEGGEGEVVGGREAGEAGEQGGGVIGGGGVEPLVEVCGGANLD